MLDFLILMVSSAMLCPLAFFWAACPCCVSCNSVCSTGINQLQIVADGISDAHCTGCASANSTYIVSYADNPLVPGCSFTTQWTSDICRTEGGYGASSTATVQARIWQYTGGLSSSPVGLTPVVGNYYLRASIGECGYLNSNAVSFEADLGSTLPDCAAFEGLSLTYDGGDLAGSGGQCFFFDPGLHCDGSTATCEVSAV